MEKQTQRHVAETMKRKTFLRDSEKTWLFTRQKATELKVKLKERVFPEMKQQVGRDLFAKFFDFNLFCLTQIWISLFEKFTGLFCV